MKIVTISIPDIRRISILRSLDSSLVIDSFDMANRGVDDSVGIDVVVDVAAAADILLFEFRILLEDDTDGE
jgi:hypothetical protein